MRNALEKFYAFLDRPLYLSSRFILGALSVPLLLAFLSPLWNISMVAPQYPKGLSLDIYTYKVEGGNEGQDIKEINTLNHYIGMAHIDREQLSDLDWIPFALGLFLILTLRVAAVGNVRALIDLCVMSFYFSAFAMGRFIYKLYSLGHNLDPHAPMTIAPFMPAYFGTKQIANFTVTSLPRGGSVYMAVFVGGICAIALWHLIAGRIEASRAEKA